MVKVRRPVIDGETGLPKQVLKVTQWRQQAHTTYLCTLTTSLRMSIVSLAPLKLAAAGADNPLTHNVLHVCTLLASLLVHTVYPAT